MQCCLQLRIFLLLLFMLLSSCSMFSSGGYVAANPRDSANLTLPPGLTNPATTQGTGSQPTESKYLMLNQLPNMQLVQAESQRWLLIKHKSASTVWPLMIEYLNEQGLTIKHADMHLGMLETNWITKDNIVPETGMRKLFDRVGMGKMYSLQSQYQFRVTILGDKGDTLVFVTDYQMNEVYPECVANLGQNIRLQPSENQETKWMPVPADPQLELGFLLQFMQFLS